MLSIQNHHLNNQITKQPCKETTNQLKMRKFNSRRKTGAYRKTGKQVDRQTDRQTGRHRETDRHTVRQTDRQTDMQAGR